MVTEATPSRGKLAFGPPQMHQCGFSWNWQKIVAAGVTIFVLQAVLTYASYQEISWKEFYSRFLEPNMAS